MNTVCCDERSVAARTARFGRAGCRADHRAALHAHDDADRSARALNPFLAGSTDATDPESALAPASNYSPLHPALSDRNLDCLRAGRARIRPSPVPIRLAHPTATSDRDHGRIDE